MHWLAAFPRGSGGEHAANFGSRLSVKGLLAGLFLIAAAAVAPLSTGYEVVLTWSAPASSPDPVAGYDIYRAEVGFSDYIKINSAPIAATAYTDAAVQLGASYVYYVKSVDAHGNQSSPSNTWAASIPSHAPWKLRKDPIVLLFAVLCIACLVVLVLAIRLRASGPK